MCDKAGKEPTGSGGVWREMASIGPPEESQISGVFFFFWLHHTAYMNLPPPGIEPGSWQRKPRILTARPPGSSPKLVLLQQLIGHTPGDWF